MDQLPGVPLLVLGNKNDLEGAASVNDLIKALQLESIQNRPVSCYSPTPKSSRSVSTSTPQTQDDPTTAEPSKPAKTISIPRPRNLERVLAPPSPRLASLTPLEETLLAVTKLPPLKSRSTKFKRTEQPKWANSRLWYHAQEEEIQSAWSKGKCGTLSRKWRIGADLGYKRLRLQVAYRALRYRMLLMKRKLAGSFTNDEWEEFKRLVDYLHPWMRYIRSNTIASAMERWIIRSSGDTFSVLMGLKKTGTSSIEIPRTFLYEQEMKRRRETALLRLLPTLLPAKELKYLNWDILQTAFQEVMDRARAGKYGADTIKTPPSPIDTNTQSKIESPKSLLKNPGRPPQLDTAIKLLEDRGLEGVLLFLRFSLNERYSTERKSPAPTTPVTDAPSMFAPESALSTKELGEGVGWGQDMLSPSPDSSELQRMDQQKLKDFGPRSVVVPRRLRVSRRELPSLPSTKAKTNKFSKAVVRPQTGIARPHHVASGVLSASSQDKQPLERLPLDADAQKSLPRLQFGLDNVLFEPSTVWVKDPETGESCFAKKAARKLPKIEKFAFERVNGFIRSSQDSNLHKTAVEMKKPFVGSTSSLTFLLTHLYFLISRERPLDTSRFSSAFANGQQNKTIWQRSSGARFTDGMKSPGTVTITYKDGVYAVDGGSGTDDIDTENKNLLSSVGIMLEKYLTLPPKAFHKLGRAAPAAETPPSGEVYQVSQSRSFLMRSQLDCHDQRLGGTGTFDIKTRATVAIRHDRLNHQLAADYEIRTMEGLFESFEREDFDLLRSALIKYNFQARIGAMQGIFIAYHNVKRFFGFRYMPVSEMDERLFGSKLAGDRVFTKCVELLDVIADASIVCLFESRGKRLRLWIRPSKPTPTKQRTPMTELTLNVDNFIDGKRVDGVPQFENPGAKWEIRWKLLRLNSSDDHAVLQRYKSAWKRQLSTSKFVLPEDLTPEQAHSMWQGINYGSAKPPQQKPPTERERERFMQQLVRPYPLVLETRRLAEEGRKRTAAASRAHARPPGLLEAEAPQSPKSSNKGPPSEDLDITVKYPPESFLHAADYIRHVRHRLEDQPQTYKRFIETLRRYDEEHLGFPVAYQSMAELLKEYPDLLEQFMKFFPTSRCFALPNSISRSWRTTYNKARATSKAKLEKQFPGEDGPTFAPFATPLHYYHALLRSILRGVPSSDKVTGHRWMEKIHARPGLPVELASNILRHAGIIRPHPSSSLSSSHGTHERVTAGVLQDWAATSRRRAYVAPVPFDRQILHKAACFQLVTISKDQGWTTHAQEGSCSWFEIGIVPAGDDGSIPTFPGVKLHPDTQRPLRWTSHYNEIAGSEYYEHAGVMFGSGHEVWDHLSPGDRLGVWMCAEHAAWACLATKFTLKVWEWFI
ncbi:hypothetical protein FRB99_006418 [Tulasnella sp. 403]|nr:hypothetical protein FRB99_006418 [Tulasnella sp. 403]